MLKMAKLAWEYFFYIPKNSENFQKNSENY